MKTKYLFLTSLIFAVNQVFCQQVSDEATIRNQVLNNISLENDKKIKDFEDKFLKYDKEIKKIDSTISRSNSDNETITKLKERVKLLEEKENTQKLKELSVYQANYQTAIINLVSMEREIRPLEMFLASQEFYSQLNQISNPYKYPSFEEWYSSYKSFLEENKKKDATLAIAAKVLKTAENVSKTLIVTGPVSECLFATIDKFIQTLGSPKKKELQEKSLKMFTLLMTISQFTTDKNLIEDEWEDLNKQLSELKSLQEKSLNDALIFVNIDRANFKNEFLRETNAIKSLQYLNRIKDLVAAKVKAESKKNTENWKDKLYLEMQSIQSLKIRFGQTTSHIDGNLKRYNDLIKKYSNDDILKGNMSGLETKLNKLSKSFDNAFNPQKYISDAVKMYKVY